ncbi:MetQ/NlpA family ABC transporter substrate-binding protein [Clostridium sp. ATCC 25772]|uniref:MetQ/NlpA family ABC transporter substrate-binding protein n=1 Tax=Clostridium sp. ATCC 25772 TaxID=1676991 RepID=UPI0007823D26|nr:MetQ/NlpA family ABC transporter substrate-binding protein [Clostridium sp. ATCC 25772]
MKKSYFTIILLTLSLIIFTACSPNSGSKDSSKETNNSNEKTIVIGASPVPHTEILEFAKTKLKDKGINLEIKTFTDYVVPNKALDSGELDANFFQHKPYLDDFNKNNGTDLISIGEIHGEPLSAYSKKITNLNDLKEGSTIAIPNDGSNGTRALKLLEKEKLITLKDSNKTIQTEKDIKDNLKNFKIKSIEASQLPRILEDVDIAIINGNYALDAGLDTKSTLFSEDISDINEYVNIIATTSENKNNEALKELVDFLKSDEMKHFIEDKYGNAILPAN